ncbi:uncharacterized protein LOC114420627 [Glycine soja]|uniref:uncharacterized protein n=1 Tax=Glycine max TaxID=3847 RepID=UPI0003DE886F|nr:uncharacterized protein LOC102660337 [Glycine max]XP_028242275.1 uncharacterized protein LOC114420627 [Glycine soja]|eukprot:XP_006584380.1 uncharacterized protein LOC102660337 [Glycine max]
MSNYRSMESSIKNLEIQRRVQEEEKDEGDQFEEGRVNKEGENEEEEKKEEEKKVLTSKTKSQLARQARKEEPPTPLKEPSYPLMPSKKNKELYFKRFLEIFKGLEITMSFGEVLQQMSFYTKFMMDILTKKGKYIDNENIVVGGNYSAVIQRKLPKKFKDPGSVTIPFTIWNVSVRKALIDLGAHINLMPLSMCRRIGNLKIDPTKMTLQLTDQSIIRPYGVVKDVFVKVRHFTLPVDFVIMDIEEDTKIPLILGRPFMLTSNCVVDIGNDNLEMSVDDQKVTFNLFEAIKYTKEDMRCFKAEEVDKEDVNTLQTTQTSLEKALINVVDCLTSEEEKDLRACLEDLDREENIPIGGTSFEELKSGSPFEKTKVEIKILPNHLKYVLLEENETKPMVISSDLTAEEENTLVEVLKRHGEAIGWHISDFKGIIPAYYMHKIMMEEDYRTVRQP